MPYYEKHNLSEWVKSNPTEEKLQMVFYQILRGLEYLHSCQIIHCDIKPENIFIDANGCPKIGDFDVSKDLNSNDDHINAFTINYMPPGNSGNNLDFCC
jgi:protein kinase A